MRVGVSLWTRVAGVFPNTIAILRLTTAVLVEYYEEWVTGKAYWKPRNIGPKDLGEAKSQGVHGSEAMMQETTNDGTEIASMRKIYRKKFV